jgi:hypothetical protein
LLWEEYREANPAGYRYSRFCELYQRWRKKLDVVMRQEHEAGEKAFVDWAGSTIPIYDRTTGVFHGKLPCSSLPSAPVPTPGPKPPASSRWKLGCVRTCTPSIRKHSPGCTTAAIAMALDRVYKSSTRKAAKAA